MSVHFLKSWSAEFAAAKAGEKTFEMRKDDREPKFEKGDVVVLREFSFTPDGSGVISGHYAETGWLTFHVGYVERSRCLPAGWCGFSLEKASAKDKRLAVDASTNGTASRTPVPTK